MDYFYDTIQLLKNTSSTLEKQKILEGLRDGEHNEVFKKIFNATMNPQINYYLTLKREELHFVGGADTLTESFIDNVVEQLNGRRVTGHLAKIWLLKTMSYLTNGSQEVMLRVINRDLDCKVAEGLVNRVWKGLIPEYPCMLAKDFDEAAVKFFNKEGVKDFVIQLKADGGRANARVEEDGTVSFFSRNGNSLLTHGVFDKELSGLFNGYVIDGELVVVSNDGLENRQTGNGLFNKAVRQTISVEEANRFRFIVWDLIPIDKFDAGYDGTPYTKRLNDLVCLASKLLTAKIQVIETEVCQLDGVEPFFEKMLARGEEGAILKVASMPWEAKRSKYMVKLKEEKEADLMCIGWTPHTKNPELIGSLTCATSCGKLETEVGSGLTDDLRQKSPEFFLGNIMKIKYNAIIKARDKEKYALFLPRLMEVRTDKNEADEFEKLK